MDKKLIRQFVEQFGREWECSCKTPFGMSSLEIVSETEEALLAHYVCPNCGREQMLAASISEERYMLESTLQTIYSGQLSSDDVLDIHEEVKNMKLATIKAFGKSKNKKTTSETAKTSSRQKQLKG